MATSKRPAGAMVIAVFNLVFGLPCVCCTGFASVGSMMSAVNPGKNQEEIKIDDKDADKMAFLKLMKQELEKSDVLEKEVPHMAIANFVIYAIGALGSLLMFVSGILLLMMRNSGRQLCIVGSVLLLITFTADMLYSAVFVYPPTKKFEEKKQREGKESQQDSGMGPGVSALVGPCAGLAVGGGYALLAIAVMLSGVTRDAFAAAARERDSDRPGDDYSAYDRPPDDFDNRPNDDFR
jgi:uncharacterized membrane protein